MPFNLFSARTKPPAKPSLYVYDSVPQKFRVQVWYILERAFGRRYYEASDYSSASFSYGLWVAVRDILRQEVGVFSLSQSAAAHNPKEECFHFFINEIEASGALDFIDLTFRLVDKFVRSKPTYILEEGGVELSPDNAVAELNERLDQHHLGYQFTGGELMRRDSQFIHKEVTEPAIQLLANSDFEGPNEEFLRAHKAYLSGNMKEAIREALNAFESTLKAIFAQRKWKFDSQKDTSAKLLSIAFDQGLVPSYLQAEFTGLRTTLEAGVPTLRNRTAGHGQGPDPVAIPNHLAAYALHMTGSAIMFLVAAHENLK
jgi:hypothetical protein